MIDRETPGSKELELKMLRFLLDLDEREQSTLLLDLNKEMFFYSESAQAYKAIIKVASDNGYVTLDTLISKLGNKKSTPLITVGLLLNHEVQSTIASLKEFEYKRKTIRLGLSLVDTAYNQDHGITDIEKVINIESAKVINSNFSKRSLSTEQMIKNALHEIQQASSKDNNVAVPYDTPYLDNVCQLMRGQVHSSGGYPGTGKTALYLEAAMNQVLAGRKVLYFCVESSAEELFKRNLSNRTNIPVGDLLLGNDKTVNPSEVQRILRRSQDFMKLADNFKIYGARDFAMTIDGVAKECYKFVRENGDIDAIYLDYLQRLKHPDPKANKVETVGYSMEGFTSLVNDLNCAGTCLCQFNRASHGSAPDINSFKDSSSIEDNSHVMTCLYRTGDKAKDRNAEIIQTRYYSVKTRLIPAFSKSLQFEGRSCKYSEGHRYSDDYRPAQQSYYDK